MARTDKISQPWILWVVLGWNCTKVKLRVTYLGQHSLKPHLGHLFVLLLLVLRYLKFPTVLNFGSTNIVLTPF